MEVGQESVTQNEASVVPVQDIEPVVIPEDTTVSQLRTIFLESIITNDFEQFSAAVEFYKCHSHLHEDQSDIFVEKLPLVMLVSKLGRLNYLQKLLELPIDVAICDSHDENSLHKAARNGREACAELLLAHGISVNSLNKDNWSPLHCAACNGRTETTKLLVERNAMIHLATKSQKKTALHFAVQNGHFKSVEILLEAGSDMEIVDCEGNNAITIAALSGHRNIFEKLIEFGANYENGKDLLLLATKKGNNEIVISLLELNHDLYMPQLISMIDLLISTSPNEDENSDFIQYRNVLAAVVIVKSCTEPILSSLSDKLLKAGLEYSASISHHHVFVQIAKQFTWLIMFIYQQQKLHWKIEFANLLERSIEKLKPVWNSLNKLLLDLPQVEEELKKEAIKPLIERISVILNIYYQVTQSTTGLDVPFCPFTDTLPSFNSNNPVPDGKVNTDNEVALSGAENVEEQKNQENSPIEIPQEETECLVASHPTLEFFLFAQMHLDTLLKVIRIYPSLLTSDLEFILENIEIFYKVELDHLISLIDFTDKVSWLKAKLKKSFESHYKAVTLQIDRNNLLEASCERLLGQDTSNLKKNLQIEFENEMGTGKGVRREWFNLLSNQLFNIDNGLFFQNYNHAFQPSPISKIHHDHLNYFQFIGRFIGLSIFYEEFLDIHFTKAFYKHILGRKITFDDVADLDPQFHKNLQWVLNNDVGDLDITFSVPDHELANENEEVPLLPDGLNRTVTEENKIEYVNLVAEYKTTKAILEQIHNFRSGFYQIVPKNWITIFDEYQLDLLISGVPSIDVADWRNCTRLVGYTVDDVVLQWFWEIVESYDDTKRAALLQFVTGSNRVPLGGFSKLAGPLSLTPFSISKAPNSDQLPTATTCFNLLKLPEYESKEKLKMRLKAAITFGCQGFEFN